MSLITPHLEIAKDSICNAQHEVKIVMSELLKIKMGDSNNLATMQDAYKMLQDVYYILGTMQDKV